MAGLDWTDIYVAGGSILGCLLKNANGFHHSDIDLFLRTDSVEEADKLLSRIYTTIKTNCSKSHGPDVPIETFKTRRTVSIRAPFRSFQVVVKLNWSLMDVLFKFDVDCCSAGFDGNTVWVSERCRRAIVKRCGIPFGF